MSRALERKYNRVKGAMFEVVVKLLLTKSGYRPLPQDPNYIRGDELRGRGAWHQIDAFGLYSYGIPFLYPIRIICEAKNFGDQRVGLPEVRNFYGAYKDIQEVYFIEHYGQSADVFTKRYTDTAAMFSASGFTVPAQDYAYAQGIRLISYESNPILWSIIPLMEICINSTNLYSASDNITDFKNWLSNLLDPINYPFTYLQSYLSDNNIRAFERLRDAISSIRTSYLATAQGILPVHILSEMEIPWNRFYQSDRVPCEVYYSIERPNLFRLKVSDSDFEFYFSVPKQIVDKYRQRLEEQWEMGQYFNRRFRNSMRSFKREMLSYIDVPVTQNGVRRIISFTLDRRWLDEYME